MRVIRIAARSSDLARIQAVTVGEKIRELGDYAIEYAFKKSLGDIHQNDPLWKMPEKGVFTEDFRADLLSGACDLVVHSWKDLPTELRPESVIAATLPREDLRDLLLFKRSSLEALHSGRKPAVRILSSSPRRSHNLTPFLRAHLPASRETGMHSEVEFVPVRGNIPTRLRKLIEGDEDGLIVAKAALDRILETTAAEWASVREDLRQWLDSLHFMVLPVSANPSAAAQGALAIEIREDRKDLADFLSGLNCEETYRTVSEERAILRGHGGGCHQKIGVTILPREYGDVISLRGETDAKGRLDRFAIRRNRILDGASLDSIWPKNAQERERLALFSRERLAVKNPGGNLWVSKAEALPPDWTVSSEQVVWASGLSTWKKLAQRGVWVAGSAEGLGEDEDARLETLLGQPPRFTKLGHREGVRAEMPLLATYALMEPELTAELKEKIRKIFQGKTHFYWMSGSLFAYCLRAMPELRDAHHACGPGNTFRIIADLLGTARSIDVFTSPDEWRTAVTGTSPE